jgi:hypothetical protein
MAEMKVILIASYEEIKVRQERMMAIMEAGPEEMKYVAQHQLQWKLSERWRTYVETSM